MKATRYALTLALMLGSATAASAMDDLDALLEPIRASYDLPALAAAVVKDGEIIAAGAVGTRVYGRDMPVTLDDRFHIGSDTKAMTATLAGRLVDEGLISWDSTVGDVLGDKIEGMSPELAAVTLAQLLSHSSGIPSDTDEMLGLYFSSDAFDYTPWDQRLKMIDAWKANVPKVPEGSPFQYANFGYLIAGTMLETVAGRPWEQLITEEIFDPLDLTSAGLGPTATPGRYDAAIGHWVETDGTVTPRPWGVSADFPSALGPAGNAHMSILDFARWAAWNAAEGKRGPALVKPETLAEIHREHVRTPHRENPPPGTPGDGGYGFGWGVVEFDWTDGPVLTHNGSNSMNLAKILVDVDDDLGIVTTTNFPGAKADAATADVLEALYRSYGAN